MKILLINWMDMDNPQAGGAEVHLTEIFRRFVTRGDEVTLLASGYSDGANTGEYEGIRIIHTGSRESFNFLVPGAARRLDRRERFDLIVEDINKIPFFTPLYIRKPLLVMVPHLFGSAVFHETNAVIGSYVYLMEKPIPWVYRSAQFEVISESTAADLAHRGIDSDNIHVVHCGMEHDTYTCDPATVKFDVPTIVYVGRIKRYKSVDVILRAMPAIIAAVPAARLVIVGSGDDTAHLKRLAAELDIDQRVVFTGFVSTEEKVNWMQRSHVIVNPSPKEGWGLTNIEANACGTPAIASDADGLRDSVVDGETGFLFPYGDSTTLSLRVIALLRDKELYARITANAHARALTFTWDAAAEDTMKVVDLTLGKHRARKR